MPERTRDSEIHEVRAKLKGLAQDCVHCDLIEPAQSLLAAVQFCDTAADQLAQAGEGDTPYPPPAPMSGEMRRTQTEAARRILGIKPKAPAEGQRSNGDANSQTPT